MKEAAADGQRLTWLIATRNSHKVDEIRAILGGNFQYLTLQDFPARQRLWKTLPILRGTPPKNRCNCNVGCSTPLVWIRPQAGQEFWVLADDSGLEVDALGGAPGVHSARFAALEDGAAANAGNSPDSLNNARLLRFLADVPREKRTAHFRCVIAITRYWLNQQAIRRSA